MTAIRIQRTHNLGLARARKVAARWAANAEKKHQVACRIDEGAAGDTLQFSRSGFEGTMQVTADSFDVQVKLGLMLRPFAGRIESEAARTLDEALAREASKMAGGAG